jgi:hypothetical protein
MPPARTPTIADQLRGAGFRVTAVRVAPCRTASDDHGFEIGKAEVTYWGLCPGCSTTRTARSSSAP